MRARAPPVGAQAQAELRGELQCRLGHFGGTQSGARGDDPAAQLRFLRPPRCREGFGIAFEAVAPAHDFHATRKVVRRADFDREPEAVEQLRPQFAFLGVATADEDEARRVAHAQALAFDHVLARRRDVDEQIHEVILEQVHLVDVEEAAVRARQQPRFERLLAARQRTLQVERADHAILGRTERQIDHGDAL